MAPWIARMIGSLLAALGTAFFGLAMESLRAGARRFSLSVDDSARMALVALAILLLAVAGWLFYRPASWRPRKPQAN